MASFWCHSSLLLRVDSFLKRPCLPHVDLVHFLSSLRLLTFLRFVFLVGVTLGLENCLCACDIRDMPSSDETVDCIKTYVWHY